MTEVPPPLTSNEPAHLWFLRTGCLGEPAVREPWMACLEPHERMRYSAYGTSASRDEYLATRALVRAALAHYTGQPAERLRFGIERGERPRLIWPSMRRLGFSLAKSRELAVGLFALGLDVGVDVELVAPIRGVEAVELAERFFSRAEVAVLSTLEGEARLIRFYQLWTLREAYLKARGVGLTLPLDQLAFRPDSSGGANAEFGAAIGDEPGRWRFGLHWIGGRHLAATCIRRTPSATPARIVELDARSLIHACAPLPSG